MKRVKKPFSASIFLYTALSLILGLSAVIAQRWALNSLQGSLDRDKPLWETSLGQIVGQTVSFGRAELKSLWPPTFAAYDLKVVSAADASPMIESSQVLVRLAGLPLFGGRIRASQIRLIAPQIHLIKSSDGHWNWSTPDHSSARDPMVQILPLRFLPPLRLSSSSETPAYLTQPVILLRDETRDKPFAFALRLPNTLGTCSDNRSTCRIFSNEGNDASLSFDIEYNSIEDEAYFQFADANLKIEASGVLTSPSGKTPHFQISWKNRGTELAEFERLFPQKAGQPFLSGALHLELELEGDGLSPDEILTALNASGAFEIRDAVLQPINLIHALLSELIPDLAPASGPQTSETPSWLTRLRELRDTKFDIARGQLTILNETIELTQVDAQSAYYLIQAEGKYSLRDGSADFAGNFVLLDQLSGFLLKVYPNLNSYKNARGRLVVPFRIRGLTPNPTLTVLTKLTYENKEEAGKIGRTNGPHA